jgi:hypothetical protein
MGVAVLGQEQSTDTAKPTARTPHRPHVDTPYALASLLIEFLGDGRDPQADGQAVVGGDPRT